MKVLCGKRKRLQHVHLITSSNNRVFSFSRRRARQQHTRCVTTGARSGRVDVRAEVHRFPERKRTRTAATTAAAMTCHIGARAQLRNRCNFSPLFLLCAPPAAATRARIEEQSAE